MKNCRNKTLISFKLHAILGIMIKSSTTTPLRGQILIIVFPAYPCCVCYPPVNHLIAISVTRCTVAVYYCFYSNNPYFT